MGSHKELQAPDTRTLHRRQMRLVNPAFQWKYTASVVLGAFFVYTLMSLMLFWVLHQQARARTLNPIATNAWENTSVIVIAAAAFAVVLAIALGAWSFIMTHRICGPLFVMERYLGELAAGRFPKRRPLRKKDEFKEFYNEFWRAMDAVKARERSHLEAMNRLLNTAQSAAQADDEERQGGLQRLARLYRADDVSSVAVRR